LTWEQPRPIRQQVRKYPAKDGASIPNSVTEDIGGFSIAPWYSLKQLRRINYIEKGKVKHTHENLKWFHFRSDISVPVQRQVLTKDVHNQEAIL